MIPQWRQRVNKLLLEYDYAKRQVVDEKRNLSQSKQLETDSAEAQKIVQVVAERVQHEAHKQVASVVSRCLSAVFEEDAYDFQVRFEQKRGKTEAKLIFCRDDLELDPCSKSGGGAVDVASFGLRLVSLLLNKPRRRRLLVLDEPFARLRGSEYQQNVNELLPTLAREMETQIILVGDTWLEVVEGKEIRLG